MGLFGALIHTYERTGTLLAARFSEREHAWKPDYETECDALPPASRCHRVSAAFSKIRSAAASFFEADQPVTCGDPTNNIQIRPVEKLPDSCRATANE